MQVLNFIINNILTQASIIIALIALLGLVLQKKPVGVVISGTMKTMLGFLVLSRRFRCHRLIADVFRRYL